MGKILHLIEALGRGGAERRLVLDLRHFGKRSFQHVVCHLYPEEGLKEEIASLHIPTLCLGMKQLSEWPRGMMRLIQVVKQHHVDLIHTQLFGADMMGRIAGRLLKIPVVSTIQSSVYEPGIRYFRSPGRRFLDGWTGRLCNEKFIAVSHFVKRSVQERLRYREKDIVVIYNGVDSKEFSPNGNGMRLRDSLGWQDEETFLICVGKLNFPKGQHILIQAVAKVIQEYPRIKLLIVGSGPSEGELQALARRLGLIDSVLFMGDRKDIQELLEASDLFVFPSFSEGMPMALLEAMAMQKPCIASDIPPIREVIEDQKTGLLVPPGSPEAISKAILELLRAPEKAERLASCGREAVIEKFHAKKSAESLERLYQDLLGGGLKEHAV